MTELHKSKITDARWRLNHLYPITTKAGTLEIFRENSIQKYINDNDVPRKMILKARQFGISTNEILKCLDFAAFNKNKNVCILAHENDAIKKLFNIVRRALKYMDPSFRPILERGGGSKYEIYFPEIDSRIYCDLESRGDTIHKLHISEMAFIKEPTRVDATLQAVPIGGEVGIETTPNGLEEFYELWREKNSTYHKFFFPWYMHDEYALEVHGKLDYTKDEQELFIKAKKQFNIKLSPEQIAFRRFKMSEIKKLFSQEYPEDDITCFLMSGHVVMDLVNIQRLISELDDPIRSIDDIIIYEELDNRAKYVIGGDTSEGVGGDYSTASVIRVDTRKQVASFRGQLKPSDFAHKLKQIAEMYTYKLNLCPLLAVERNNHGHAVLLELNEHILYKNLYKTLDERVGWVTDKVTRPIMLDAFIESMDNNTIGVNQFELLNECLTLIEDKGKIQAAINKHDDCVIAHSIALQMVIAESGSMAYTNISSMIRV